tara:strand:- start:5336 stop:5653 length:318 start_codon:yes stop_codon:yes gene_type:complete
MDYDTWRKMTSSKKVEPKKEEESVVLLKNRINHLENEIKNLKNKKLVDKIDNFVDTWFEANKDDVDIGNVEIGPFKIDLLPDEMEKHIYKKSLKIFVTMMGDMIK